MLGRVFKKWRVRDKCAYLMVVYPVEVSGQRDYARTGANVECFDGEAEAIKAGYRKAVR